MNRSALCIKMLQILNAHDFVTTKELASRLETNPRNIIEFKKELETSGYMIESVKGRYGGYRLMEKAALPLIQLNDQEKQAMNEAYSYLTSHKDFLLIRDYTLAYEKIKSFMSFSDHKSDVLFYEDIKMLDEGVYDMIRIMEQAKKESCSVSFEYKSLHASKFLPVELCPYEIMNIQGEYYCLGYSQNRHDFRTYKFSTVRMRNVLILDKHFTRDLDFNVNAYLGKSGLMKDEVIETEFVITGKNAVLYAERRIGVNPKMYFDDQQNLHVKTLFEGKMNAMQFLCSLGASCQLISPIELKKELQQEIRKMMENYE